MTNNTLLHTAIPPQSHVGIDTMLFIYFLDEYTPYFEQSAWLFGQIREESIIGSSSILTRTEVLSSSRMTEESLVKYEQFFDDINIQLYEIDKNIADQAAFLRRKYHLHTPDTIQLATAIVHKADLFLTNDATLKKVSEIKVVVFGELK